MNYRTWCSTQDELEFIAGFLNDEHILIYTVPTGIHFSDDHYLTGHTDEALFAESKDAFVDINELIKCNTKNDPVNHPSHYASTKVECIDAMEQMFGKKAVIQFAILNAWKYLWRRKDKGNEEQDIQKACWYFDKAKELINK